VNDQESGPRRITLGADSWIVLVEALSGLELPSPFGVDGSAELTPEQRERALTALRGSDAVPGQSNDLADDLHPSLRASLLAQTAPEIVIASRVGLGGDVRVTRHAIQGAFASSLARERREADEVAELGPVTLGAMRIDDVVADVVGGLGVPDAAPESSPLELDAAVALASVRALKEGRPEVVRSLLGQEAIPEPLEQATAGLDAVARIDVASRAGTVVIVAISAGGAWWTATIGGGELELAPVGRRELVTELAGVLAGRYMAEAATR